MAGKEGLNGLADHLLVEILSLLPLKSAIATAVLSRRWRWLWTHVTDIDIDITLYPTYSYLFRAGKLRTLVQSVLPKLTSPFIHSLSFHLDYGNEDYMYEDDVEPNSDNIVSWYDWASRHKNHLRKLRILLKPGPGMIPDAPLWIFQIPSLEVLELEPWWLRLDYNLDNYRNLSFHLPNLKKVCVHLLRCCKPWILEKLVSCSPSLEVLSCQIYLPYSTWNENPTIINLSNRNLKRLEMECSQPIHVVIDAPKLEYLSFHANKYNNNETLFYKISFVDSPTALLTCSISPWTDHQGRDIFLPSNLFSVISGVRSLTTADQNPTPFIASTITFGCLTHLRFLVRRDLNEAEDMEGLGLLQQCPILEVLTLDLSEYLQRKKHKWSLPDSTPQCLVTNVKRIEILAHPFVVGLKDMLLHLLNYLLGNDKVLELLKISIIPPRRDVAGYSSARYDEIQLIKEVFKVPRCSPQSQVEFYSPDRSVVGEEGLTTLLDNIRDDSLVVGKDDDLTNDNEENEGNVGSYQNSDCESSDASPRKYWDQYA